MTHRDLFWLNTTRLLMRATLWCWRRQAEPRSELPDGVPHHRSSESPCPAFEPRQRDPLEVGRCEGDGHYLCAEACALWLRDDEEVTP